MPTSTVLRAFRPSGSAEHQLETPMVRLVIELNKQAAVKAAVTALREGVLVDDVLPLDGGRNDRSEPNVRLVIELDAHAGLSAVVAALREGELLDQALPPDARCTYCKNQASPETGLVLRLGNGDILCSDCEWYLAAPE